MSANNGNGYDVVNRVLGGDYFDAAAGDEPTGARSVRELVAAYPQLRPVVVDGIAREGETVNVISSPKVGKSWLVDELAICGATGRAWLSTFNTRPTNVLILDNELHP